MIFDTNVYLDLCFYPKEKLIRLASENTLVAPNFLKMEIINVFIKYHSLKSIQMEILEKYERFTFDLVDVFVPDF
jgi:phage tail sheath gpL-like